MHISRSTVEGMRRAEIISRYVAIPLPTANDDVAFARELGSSKDLLLRLSRSWRLHGDPALLEGARAKLKDFDREQALAATEHPDLTGVDPARREETLRRISGLRAYLGIEQPVAQDLAMAAQNLGVSHKVFSTILRSWLIHRSPAFLPAAATPIYKPSRKPPKISASVEAIMARAIARLGNDVSSLRLTREIAQECHASGLEAPCQVTVYKRQMKTRALTGDTAQPQFLIDHCALSMALIAKDGTRGVPVVSALLFRPTGRIVAYRIGSNAPTAEETARLTINGLDALGNRHEERVPLDIGFADTDGWDKLRSALSGALLEPIAPRRTFKPGKTLGKAIGDRLGKLRLRPSSTMRPREVPSNTKLWAGIEVTLEQAATIIAEAVDLHNRDRAPVTSTFVSRDQAVALRKTLVEAFPSLTRAEEHSLGN